VAGCLSRTDKCHLSRRGEATRLDESSLDSEAPYVTVPSRDNLADLALIASGIRGGWQPSRCKRRLRESGKKTGPAKGARGSVARAQTLEMAGLTPGVSELAALGVIRGPLFFAHFPDNRGYKAAHILPVKALSRVSA